MPKANNLALRFVEEQQTAAWAGITVGECTVRRLIGYTRLEDTQAVNGLHYIELVVQRLQPVLLAT